jgi:plasmid stabilization system protein ParE
MPSALGQLDEARRWWSSNRDKAPQAFDEDVDAMFELLEDRPTLVGRPVARDPRVRRTYLGRIRYYVYFQIDGARDVVEILAIWHGSRGSAPEL